MSLVLGPFLVPGLMSFLGTLPLGVWYPGGRISMGRLPRETGYSGVGMEGGGYPGGIYPTHDTYLLLGMQMKSTQEVGMYLIGMLSSCLL